MVTVTTTFESGGDSHHHFFTCNVNFFTLFLCWKGLQKVASSPILQETHRKPITVSAASLQYTVYVVNVENLCTNFDFVLPKPFSFRGLRPPNPHQGLCPWTPLGALPSSPRYRLALHTLAICPHLCHQSPPLFGVKLLPWRQSSHPISWQVQNQTELQLSTDNDIKTKQVVEETYKHTRTKHNNEAKTCLMVSYTIRLGNTVGLLY